MQLRRRLSAGAVAVASGMNRPVERKTRPSASRMKRVSLWKIGQPVDHLLDANHAHAASLADAFAEEVQRSEVVARQTVHPAVVADEGTHDLFSRATRRRAAQRARRVAQHLDRAGEGRHSRIDAGKARPQANDLTLNRLRLHLRPFRDGRAPRPHYLREPPSLGNADVEVGVSDCLGRFGCLFPRRDGRVALGGALVRRRDEYLGPLAALLRGVAGAEDGGPNNAAPMTTKAQYKSSLCGRDDGEYWDINSSLCCLPGQ